jgi:hypothetical protein
MPGLTPSQLRIGGVLIFHWQYVLESHYIINGNGWLMQDA